MNPFDIVILVLLAAAVFFALRQIFIKRGCSCGGSCGSCSCGCADCSRSCTGVRKNEPDKAPTR
ncbi:MAG: hypothetical protein IJM76_03030 [Lachnospiraceae bacterium]|nr:hypothetical protein [Lachnospiraceae bacterium]